MSLLCQLFKSVKYENSTKISFSCSVELCELEFTFFAVDLCSQRSEQSTAWKSKFRIRLPTAQTPCEWPLGFILSHTQFIPVSFSPGVKRLRTNLRWYQDILPREVQSVLKRHLFTIEQVYLFQLLSLII